MKKYLLTALIVCCDLRLAETGLRGTGTGAVPVPPPSIGEREGRLFVDSFFLEAKSKSKWKF